MKDTTPTFEVVKVAIYKLDGKESLLDFRSTLMPNHPDEAKWSITLYGVKIEDIMEAVRERATWRLALLLSWRKLGIINPVTTSLRQSLFGLFECGFEAPASFYKDNTSKRLNYWKLRTVVDNNIYEYTLKQLY